jgi:hypothetical protein
VRIAPEVYHLNLLADVVHHFHSYRCQFTQSLLGYVASTTCFFNQNA